MKDQRFGLFHLPPGADFAQGFADGLLARYRDHPPEVLAGVTVYLNSERMRRRVHECLCASGSHLLTRLNLLTDLAHDPILAGLPPPEPPLRRLLTFARIVQGLLARDGSLAPRSAAFDLAAALSDLTDEMQAEGVTPGTIAALKMDQFASYWQRSQTFLSIIAPLFAEEGGAGGMAARQRLAAARLAARWASDPPPGPVIVAGSTGSRGPTLLLMRAVAGLAQGALVLPGFDAGLPPPVWGAMKDAMSAEDHPQYRLRRLIALLEAEPADVAPWHAAPAPDPARNAVLSLALRPAPVTDHWLEEGQKLTGLPQVLQGITLVQAENPQEEAAAIALILREGAERGLPCALITPDRALGRRVTAALTEWGIRPDDSAGRPLALSPPGRFLRHIARLMARPLTADGLITLLKHPLCHSGTRRGDHLRLTRELELSLRRYGPAFPGPADLTDWAGKQSDAFAPVWAASLGAALALLEHPQDGTLAQRAALHLRLAEDFARGSDGLGSGDLWLEEAGAQARALMADLDAEAAQGAPTDAQSYQRLFEALIQRLGGDQRDTQAAHPLIAILGPREARESGAQRVILAGLNEGSWPRAAPPDPWMNRRMRQEAGLLLPERQIGLAAHDFQQAAGAPQVFLTRARRDADAQTVPSRWLNRLTNLLSGLPDQGGQAALQQMGARGDDWLRLAAAAAAPRPEQRQDPGLRPALRPAPSPPRAARPTRLPITAITSLIRDPYAVYARYILGLQRLDPLDAAPDARDRGTVLHAVMERFVREAPPGESAAEAEARLVALAAQTLEKAVAFPAERLLWQARLARFAGQIVAAESRREASPQALEVKGEWHLIDPDFTLHGRLDRADVRADGRVELIDYKTGSLPTAKSQEYYDKQLMLTAVMASEGAFAALGAAEVALTRYVGLLSDGKTLETAISPEVLTAERAKFHHLIARTMDRDTGYIARRALQLKDSSGDYDHLSRYGEWQMSDASHRIRIGDDDEP